MLDKKLKPPLTQRRFASPWSELDYLCKKISYWLYVRKHRTQAARYRERLARVLDDLPHSDRAILREEGLALLYELQGEIDKALAHRKREIQLMERLHRDAQSSHYADSTRTYLLQDRDETVLQQRRALVAALQKAKTRQGDEVIGSAQ